MWGAANSCGGDSGVLQHGLDTAELRDIIDRDQLVYSSDGGVGWAAAQLASCIHLEFLCICIGYFSLSCIVIRGCECVDNSRNFWLGMFW